MGAGPVEETRAPTPLATLLGEAFGLAWPVVVQGLLLTLAFQIDRIMLGHFSSETLASMQVGGPLFWSVISVATACTAGTVAVVGRAVGAGDEARAARATEAVLAFAFGVGLLAAAIVFLGRTWITDALAGEAASAAVRDAANVYVATLAPTLPLALMGTVGTSALQASGDTRTPLLISLLAQLLNLGGDALLIFGLAGLPRLGIRGAALASGGAFVLQALLVLLVLARRRTGGRIERLPLGRAHGEALRAVLRPSRAAYGEKIVFHAGFLGFVALISRLGDLAMATNQALIAIEALGFITADGFGVAAGTLVAQNLGRDAPRRAERATYATLLLGGGTLLAVAGLFVALPDALVAFFSPEPEIIALGARCLVIGAVAQPLMAAAAIFGAALRGAGDTATPLRVALVGPAGVRLFGTWALAFTLGLGLPGVWMATNLDWGVRTLWLVLAFRHGRWKQIEV